MNHPDRLYPLVALCIATPLPARTLDGSAVVFYHQDGALYVDFQHGGTEDSFAVSPHCRVLEGGRVVDGAVLDVTYCARPLRIRVQQGVVYEIEVKP